MVSNSLVILSFFLKLVGCRFVQFTDLIEFLHVLKEFWTSFQGDEEFGLLTVTSLFFGSVV